MNNEIPTHDPQTGDINPFYQELTGRPNPLSCGPHLVWWNNLTNEKQYQLNYEYFGQPELGETDFLTEKDIELIWKQETKEKYIGWLATSIKEKCQDIRFDFAALSGTSMASPLVAHAVAEIILENPHMMVKDIISNKYLKHYKH